MTETMRTARGVLALSALATVLASCTSAPKPPPKIETIIVPIPPNVEALPPPEPLPTGPLTRSEAEDLWHLRSGLNVAALMCDPKVFTQLTPNYNRLLKNHKLLLTSAVEKELSMFRAQGTKWQAAYDTHMTRVYNQYSVTKKRPEFCTAAASISTEAADATLETLTARGTVLLRQLNTAAEVVAEEITGTPTLTPAPAIQPAPKPKPKPKVVKRRP